jgi:hypothetical protein
LRKTTSSGVPPAVADQFRRQAGEMELAEPVHFALM